MSLTVTLTNKDTGKPVAYRAIRVQLNSPDDDLKVTTDQNGQFTIDGKYRNIEFLLDPQYIESGEGPDDVDMGGWRKWESDTLNIPVVGVSSGVKPRSLGAGITVAVKISRNPVVFINEDDPPCSIEEAIRIKGLDWGYSACIKIPHPTKITIQLSSPDDDLEVTTDGDGLFLIDEKYRNLECIISGPYGTRSSWVKLDNDYIVIPVDVIPGYIYRSQTGWLKPK
jgi:hypothetical protein